MNVNFVAKSSQGRKAMSLTCEHTLEKSRTLALFVRDALQIPALCCSTNAHTLVKDDMNAHSVD